MSNLELYHKLSTLPEDMKNEVADFIDFLKEKKKKESGKKKPVFGSAKGLFKMMPGFDDPLEDFKPYM